jgi:dihydroxyacid dehydratase/phosphogluconate dehydratase
LSLNANAMLVSAFAPDVVLLSVIVVVALKAPAADVMLGSPLDKRTPTAMMAKAITNLGSVRRMNDDCMFPSLWAR